MWYFSARTNGNGEEKNSVLFMDRKRKAEELRASASKEDNGGTDIDETDFVEGEASDGEPSNEEIKSDDEEFYKVLREK
jgi:hypothetical protein